MADMTPQEAAAAGLGWVPKDHPAYGTPGFVGYTAPEVKQAPPTDPSSGDPNARVNSPLYNGQPGQPGQTYSATPTAAPAPNTTNQGGQDVYRNALISLMGQDTNNVSLTDPVVEQEMGPYAAQRQRDALNEISAGAENAFANQQDYGAPEKLAIQERASQDTAAKRAELATQELAARRGLTMGALSQFGGALSEDQRNAIARAGLAQTGQLGNRELDIRQELGKLGLAQNQIDALLRDQEFMASLGLQAGTTEAELNRRALLDSMG